MQKRLKVVEIFRSIQGEGGNCGKQVSFVRLSHCNLSCWFCDTEFETGDVMEVKEIHKRLEELNCKSIIWTGGEPCLQLTDDIVDYFKKAGYWQAIETNGSKVVPQGIDYISCSPKVAVDQLRRNFANRKLGEIRYPFGLGCSLPPDIDLLPQAEHYFLSPIFMGEANKRMEYSKENLEACLKFMTSDSRWQLSLQIHKLINIP